MARIRGHISTIRKNNLNVVQALASAFIAQPILPWAEQLRFFLIVPPYPLLKHRQRVHRRSRAAR